MVIKVQSVLDTLEESGANIMIHGPAGAGKTVFCATGPGTTIIISAEAGLLSLKKYAKQFPKRFKRIKVISIGSLADLEEAYDMFSESEEQICTNVCLDSASEIAEQILYAEKQERNDPRQAYGAVQDEMGELFRKFRGLTVKGYNVVMTCKQEFIEDPDTSRMMYRAMMPGKKLPQAVPYMFDEVFALRVEHDDEDGDERYLQTGKDYKYDAKDRSGMLDMFEEPNLTAVLEKINGLEDVEATDESDDDSDEELEDIEFESEEEEDESEEEESGETDSDEDESDEDESEEEGELEEADEDSEGESDEDESEPEEEDESEEDEIDIDLDDLDMDDLHQLDQEQLLEVAEYHGIRTNEKIRKSEKKLRKYIAECLELS